MNRHLVKAVAVVAVAMALTGCSRAVTSGTVPSSSPSSVPGVSGTVTSARATAGGSAIDAGTLDGITKDLNAADNANAQTDADQQSVDQAATTNDG